MYSTRAIIILSLFVEIFVFGCTTPTTEKKVPNPLPSLNEGKTKSTILDFVYDVTNDVSADFNFKNYQ